MMKKFFALLLMVISIFGAVSTAYADTHVRGHFRKDGTYVKPHYRSDRNNTVRDNWTHRGNINPHTGERGTRW